MSIFWLFCDLFNHFSSDLAFDVEAYTFILLNDAFTAATGVYTKKKLGDQVALVHILYSGYTTRYYLDVMFFFFVIFCEL